MRYALAVLAEAANERRTVETSTYTSGLGSLAPVVAGNTAAALDRHGWAMVARAAGDTRNEVAITDEGRVALQQANERHRARTHPAARQAPLARRKQLAKAELLAMLATLCESWRRELDEDEQLREGLTEQLQRYGLSRRHLAGIADQLGAELEARADRAGYGEVWR